VPRLLALRALVPHPQPVPKPRCQSSSSLRHRNAAARGADLRRRRRSRFRPTRWSPAVGELSKEFSSSFSLFPISPWSLVPLNSSEEKSPEPPGAPSAIAMEQLGAGRRPPIPGDSRPLCRRLAHTRVPLDLLSVFPLLPDLPSHQNTGAQEGQNLRTPWLCLQAFASRPPRREGN